jgi:tetratricopeptide (TPR) repeat protein
VDRNRSGFRRDRPERGRPDRERPDRDRPDRGRDDDRRRPRSEASPQTPELTGEYDPRTLDSDVRGELRTLARPVADAVSARLVATGQLLDEEPAVALAHAMEARRLASRIPAVREAVGLAAYHAGEWHLAIAELRAYHRMTGKQTHLAVLADCERALGRPERAIDVYRHADRSQLDQAEAIELLIVAGGARRDLGQSEAAVAMLQVRELGSPLAVGWVARLRYAYADALAAVNRLDEAREWFARAAEVDDDLETDAAERLLDLDGVVLDENPEATDDTDDEAEANVEDIEDESEDEVAAEAFEGESEDEVAAEESEEGVAAEESEEGVAAEESEEGVAAEVLVGEAGDGVAEDEDLVDEAEDEDLVAEAEDEDLVAEAEDEDLVAEAEDEDEDFDGEAKDKVEGEPEA